MAANSFNLLIFYLNIL